MTWGTRVTPAKLRRRILAAPPGRLSANLARAAAILAARGRLPDRFRGNNGR